MVLKFNLPCSQEHVFQCLSDMERFCSFHPIISRMEALGDDLYRVHEEIPLGFIKYAFKYKARVLSDETNKTIDIQAVVHRINKFHMRFKLLQTASGSQVQEIVSVNSPLPIHGLMYKLIKKQHHLLFQNIEQACK